MWKENATFSQDTAGNPSGQDSTILAAWLTNHSAGLMHFILPAYRASPITKQIDNSWWGK